MREGSLPTSSQTAAAALAVCTARAGGTAPSLPGAEDSRIVHALNRLGYGPRPGEVEAVRRMGLEAWIERQLHPERIPDETVQARLASLRTLRLSVPELLAGYELPPDVRRAIRRKRQELGEDATEEQMREARREMVERYRGRMEGPPHQVVEELQAAKILRAVYSQRQLEEVLVDFWLNHFNVFAQKGPVKFLVGAYERDVIRPRAWGKFEDLLRATAEGSLAVVHAVGSPDGTRSHFDAQDFMESGTPGRKSTDDGWMNRHLHAHADPAATPFRAVALTPTLPRSLAGPAPAVAMAGIRQFALRSGGGTTAHRLEQMYQAPVRDLVHGAGRETFEALDFLGRADPARYRPGVGAHYPRGAYGESLKQIAQLIKAEVGLELAFTEVEGWDHHAAEGGVQGQLANRLREFSQALGRVFPAHSSEPSRFPGVLRA